MSKEKNLRFGDLPPRYGFMLNPYPSQRISRCPLCEQKNRQRKLPLLIHVDPLNLIAMNYTCRFCPSCDLLVAHKHAVEALLAELFRRRDPSAIGNNYVIIGTVEKSAWREGLERPVPIDELRPHVSDFAKYYPEMRLTQPGYYHVSQEPLIWKPPPSKDWVK